GLVAARTGAVIAAPTEGEENSTFGGLMKYAIATALALYAAALASGCATYYDRTAVAAPITPVIATADIGAESYTTPSFFFKDRGLHYGEPSLLPPVIVTVTRPVG